MHHQAGRPAAQHAHRRRLARTEAPGQGAGNAWRSMLPWPTVWVSARSRRSWRTCSLQYLDPVGYEEIERCPGCRNGGARTRSSASIADRIKERLAEDGMDSCIIDRPHQEHLRHLPQDVYAGHAPSTRFTTCTPCGSSWTPSANATMCWASSTTCTIPSPTALRTISPHPSPTCTSRCTPPSSDKEGIPFEVQIRTWEMHHTAEYGVAAHWKYKAGMQRRRISWTSALAWVRQLLESQQDVRGRRVTSLRDIKTELSARGGVRLYPQGRRDQPARGQRPSSTLPTPSTQRWATAWWAPRWTAALCPWTTRWRRARSSRSSPAPRIKGPSRDWLNIVATSEAKQQDPQLVQKGTQGRKHRRGQGSAGARSCAATSSPSLRKSTTNLWPTLRAASA